jgi:hypothetical protein
MSDNNESSPKRTNKRSHADAFSSTMTFASTNRPFQTTNNACACKPLMYKYLQRQRRTQDCVVRKSALNTAVREWILPVGAEPRLDFMPAHRFVYVRALPGRLQRIGSGIVGSASEEKSRVLEAWNQKSVWFVPDARTNCAVGWVQVKHTNDADDPTIVRRQTTYASLVIATLRRPPTDQQQQFARDEAADDRSAWNVRLQTICEQLLLQNKESSKSASISWKLNDEQAKIVIECMNEE